MVRVPPWVFRHLQNLLPRVRQDWWPCAGLIIMDTQVLRAKHKWPEEWLNTYKCTGTDKISEEGAINLPSLWLLIPGKAGPPFPRKCSQNERQLWFSEAWLHRHLGLKKKQRLVPSGREWKQICSSFLALGHSEYVRVKEKKIGQD